MRANGARPRRVAMLAHTYYLRRFAELLAQLPKPILAFCRSGTRSTKLFAGAIGLQG